MQSATAQTFEHEIQRSLERFIASFLNIFGRLPRFDISVFCLGKGQAIQQQGLASKRYAKQDYTGQAFQDRFKEVLFRAQSDLLGRVRNYDNFFPGFYHDFLRKTCQDEAETAGEAGESLRFFDLPRYTYKNSIYYPVFCLDMGWVESCYAALPSPDGTAFFTLLMQTLCDFLAEETRITDKGLCIDEYQAPRLKARAAAFFLKSVTGNGSFYNYINTISSLKYEKKECAAQIACCHDHDSRALRVRFTEPVAMGEHRKVRKLLAAAGEKLCLVSSGQYLTGIASALELEKDCPEPLPFFNLLGHLTWELVRNGQLLLRYSEGQLSTDRHALGDREILAFIKKRLEVDRQAAARVLALIRAARSANHGSLLVFLAPAAAEARRLQHDGFPVTPFAVDPKDLPHFSVMDGALLIDTDCHCHALGVILDGDGVDASDTSRGARFNSALRYYEKNRDERILVVVVSDDGMINLIPDPVR